MCDSPYSLYRVSGLGSLLALSGDSGGTGSSSLRVQVLATRLDRLEVLVQLVEQRDGGRDVDLGDLFLRQVVQHLDDGAEGVAVGSNQHGLAGLELRLDSGLEVRLHTLNNVGQALGFRNRIAGVARVVVLGVLVVRVDLGRRGGVRNGATA